MWFLLTTRLLLRRGTKFLKETLPTLTGHMYSLLEDELVVAEKAGHQRVRFTHLDLFSLLVLALVSFWTRHFLIYFPAEVVFDEVHFGEFTNCYVNGTYFFDIHPPLAKLIIFGVARLGQYNGAVNFSQSGQLESVDLVGLRQIPAMFASFCAPVLFLGARCYGMTTLASFTIAWMVVCDNSMIVEGKFLLTDGILHFFVCLTIMATAVVRTQKNHSCGWWLALVFNGIAAGCAVSCKMTALSVLPFVAMVHFVDLVEMYYKTTDFAKRLFRNLAERGVVIGVFALIVFFMTFVVHLILLPYTGPDVAFTPEHFGKSLIDPNDPNPDWNVRTENQNMLKNILILNYYMQYYNAMVTEPHPYASPWYSWPFLTGKWVLFWVGESRYIACHGQPFNVYCATLSVILNVGGGLYHISKRRLGFHGLHMWMRTLCFALAYCASLFPFILVGRVVFFYHYIISNIFGMVNFVAMLDFYVPRRYGKTALTVVLVLTSVAFLFWAPFTYGLPIANPQSRLLFKSWW